MTGFPRQQGPDLGLFKMFSPLDTTIQRDVRKDAGNCWAVERQSRLLYI